MTASGEVRLVPVSREQRDRLALHGWRDLSAEWDAAVPGVVDARWVEVRDLLGEYTRGWAVMCKPEARHPVQRAWEIAARAAAGGEAAVPGVVDSSWAAQVRDLLASEIDVQDHHGYRASASVVRAFKIARAAAGGEDAAARSLPSRADAVWTVDDLPHLLDEPVERPSVSLRETIETLPGVLSAIWASRNGYDEIRKREFLTIIVRVDREMVEGRQVEREAEEGERDE